MTRLISSGFQTKLDTVPLSIKMPLFVLITRNPGTPAATQEGFTEFDGYDLVDYNVGFGNVTYRVAPGFVGSLVKFQNPLRDGSAEIETFLHDTYLTKDDIESGLYREADVRTFFLDLDEIGNGPIRMSRFVMGAIEREGDRVKFELVDFTYKLAFPVARPLTGKCNLVFGGSECGARPLPNYWAASTAYTVRPAHKAAVGSVIQPVDSMGDPTFNGFHYKCVAITGSGLSGASPPTFPTTIGGQVSDNEVTWEAYTAWTWEFTVATVNDVLRDFTVSSVATITPADNRLRGGFVDWLTGDNVGQPVVGIESWTLSGTRLILKTDVWFQIKVGDTLRAQYGCQHTTRTRDIDGNETAGDCVDEYDNGHAYDGLPYAPGTSTILKPLPEA